MSNPFTPNFGQIPPFIAGRDFLMREVVDAFESGLGHPSLASVFIGARGTGKTTLLSALSLEAQAKGWLAINVVCIEGMLEDIFQQSVHVSSGLADRRGERRLTSVSLAQVVGLEWEYDESLKPNWRMRMESLLDQLAEHDVGLVITVDEVDPSLDEMIQLASLYQLFTREGRKVSLLMAGLPSHVSSLLNDKSVSFLRRASQYRLGKIEDHEVARAFKSTVELSGKTIDEKALSEAVKAAEGFPYMIQLVGFRSWQESGESDVIDEADIGEGVRMATNDLRSRVLRSTLDELSDGDVAFLEVMLEDEGPSLVADLEKRLGKTSGHISRYRRRLIDRGIVGSRGRGRLVVELPGLKEYLPEYLDMR